MSKKQTNQPREESLSNLDTDNQTQEQLKQLEVYKAIIKPSLSEIIDEEIKLSDKWTYHLNLWFMKQDEYIYSPAKNKKILLEANNEILKKYDKKWLLDNGVNFDSYWGEFRGQLEMIRWILTGRHDNYGDEDKELIFKSRKKIKKSE